MKRDTIIKGMAEIANEIDVPRSYPARGKPSTIILEIFSARVSSKVVKEFKKLPGARSHNLERAMRLLLIARGVEKV